MWLALALGCAKPPPAPEGLTDSLRYLMRSFHAEDEAVGAGLTGLMDWFDADGGELLGARADIENVGAFQLGTLAPSDVAGLPVEGDPDPRAAPGVVSVAEMDCPLVRAQGLLVRPDQEVVFQGPWRAYDREYVTPRERFEDAALDGLEPIAEPLSEASLAEHPESLLLTRNAVDSAKLGFTLAFDLDLRMRHGVFEVQGEPIEAVLLLGFFPRAAEASTGGHRITQSWSIEADLARPGGKTLRVFGAWSELASDLLAADSVFVLAEGVNDAQNTAERMDAICSGALDIPPEP